MTAPHQPINVPTGLPYGQASDMHQTEQAAPMAATPSTPSPPSAAYQQAAPAGPPPVQPPTGLGEPTEYPDQPVTHGAAQGPGAGLEAIQPGAGAAGGQLGGGPIAQAIARAASVDTSGTLAQLLMVAQQKGL